MERLTTNNPQTNLQTLLNYAYAKNGRVCLRHADGQAEKDLCEYIALRSPEMCGGVTPESVMDGACMECDCPLGILSAVATQAAELRGRLNLLEDILGDNYDLSNLQKLVEAGRNGMLLPLSVGQTVYVLLHEGVEEEKIVGIISDGKTLVVEISHFLGVYEYSEKHFGKWVFLSRESAEKAWEERKC